MSNSSQVTASYTVPSTAGLISHINWSAGTTSNNSSNISFANSNGVSFGLDVGTITATVKTDYLTQQTNQTLGLYAAGNTTGQSSSSTFDARTLTFVGQGVASVGFSNGSVNISVPSGGGAGDGYNIVSLGTTGTTGTAWSSLSASVGINGSQNVTVSQNNSNQLVVIGPDLSPYLTTAALSNHSHGFSAAGGSSAFQTLSFSNQNNVSFSNSNGQVVASASYPAQTNQSAIKAFGVSNTGQTAGNTGVSTGVDWVLAGSNSITLSQSTAAGGPNTVWVQHPAWLTTAAQSNHSHGNPTLNLTNLSGTTASNSAGFTLSLSAAGPGAGAVNFSAGTTSGNLDSVVFSNSNGVSFGLNGSTITASANAAGGGYTASSSIIGAEYGFQSTISTAGQNSLFIMPFQCPQNLSVSAFLVPMSINAATAASSSGQAGHTFELGIYTRINSTGTGLSYMSRLYSTTATISGTLSSNVSMQLGGVLYISNSTSYQTFSSSSAGISVSGILQGPRYIPFIVSSLFTPGEYWIGLRQSSSAAGSTPNFLKVYMIGATKLQLHQAVGNWTNSNTTGPQYAAERQIGLGYVGTATGMPNSLPFTSILPHNSAGGIPIITALSQNIWT